jgi:hypothetical protein
MKNASSTGAIRSISLAGAKGLSAIDASATFQSGIPAQEASASERASLRSIEHPPVAKRRGVGLPRQCRVFRQYFVFVGPRSASVA